jgi:hypothetical protein
MITKKIDKIQLHHFNVFCRRRVELLFDSVQEGGGGSRDSIYEVVVALKKMYQEAI